jgi:dTDP-4-dehydrorhamnose reductase
MLGAMVRHVFEESGHPVIATHRRDRNRPGYLDARESAGTIQEAIRGLGPVDAVVNCIGITRVDPSSPESIEEAFSVNGVFPWKLGFAARACGVRVYGISKRAGEASLPNVLSVRTSIVGPAPGGQGLLEWFLRHPDRAEVSGYTNHTWNGVTTVQLARFVLDLTRADAFDRLRAHSGVVHFSPNQPLSKYDLLRQLNKAYARDIRVRPALAPTAVTRVLSSRFSHVPPLPPERGSIGNALRELARSATSRERI